MKFELDSFSFLSLVELPEKYNKLGMPILEDVQLVLEAADMEDESYNEFASGIMSLLGSVSGALIGDEISNDHLFTVVCDDGGTVEKLRDVGVFQHPEDESKLVLRLGANLFDVQQSADPTELIIGDLKSPLVFTEIKDATGKYLYTRVGLNLRKKGSKEIHSLMCVMKMGDDATPPALLQGELLAALESGESIAPYFMKANMSGGGGGQYIDMRSLEVGEYVLLDIEEREPHPEYGDRFVLTIEGGFKFDTRGKATQLIKKQGKVFKAMLNKGKPLTFAVTSKEVLERDKDTGLPTKVSMNVSVWMRAPRVDVNALPAATIVEQKQLVGASANGKAETVDYDQIPF